MDLLDGIEKRYTIQDVQDQRVETVSVVGVDELEAAVEAAVAARTEKLQAELTRAKADLAKGSGGGLEAAAAEAALEAEARALEEKAEAENRAREAETRASRLEARVAELEAASGQVDEAKVGELEAKVAELEGKAARASELEGELAGKAARVTELEAKVAELEGKAAQVAELESKLAAAGDDGDPAEPVTEDDKRHAKRLAQALLDDVFSDDEKATNEALKKGNFDEQFKAQLKKAHQQYVKRVKAHVRAGTPFWEDTLKDYKGRAW